MQQVDPLPSNEQHSSPRDTVSGRSKPRAYAIPLLAVVFVQTLFVSALVLLVPLMISFSAMAASNEQSTATGRRVAQSLAVQVQSAEASLALDRIKSFIKSVNEQTTHVYKSISVHGNQSNLDSLLNSFANEVKYTGYPLNLYYGRQDDSFIQLNAWDRSIYLSMPVSYSSTDCVICNAFRRNFTDEQTKWADRERMAAGWADWDEKSWAAENFRFSNSTLYCTKRPWYIQAASLSSETVRIQYTEPYIFVNEVSYTLAGITVNIPFFDSKGRVTGVYGSDISFMHMHDILTDFLQSNNSFMYVMTSTGVLIGSSSSNESIVGQNGRLINANESMSKWMRSTAQFLWMLDPDVDVKNFTLLDGFQAELDDVSFQVRALLEPPYFVIVNGALKEDYSATINNLRSELTAIERKCLYVLMEASAISFAVVVSLGILFNYLTVVRPLRQMTSVMVHAARLDFTASANLGQSFRTFIKELTEMEKEFFIMVVNFANSVQESQGMLRVGAKNAFIYQSSELSDAVKVPLLIEGRKKRWSLSIAFLALLQTLLCASLVISTPLAIFFQYATYSNHYSTTTSRQIVDDLARKIQNVQGFLGVQTMESIISSINATTSDMRKTISAYSNQSNIDTIFEAFANEIRFTGLSLALLYTTRKDEFVFLQNINGNNLFVALPGDFNDPACSICVQSRVRFSSEEWDWVRKRNNSISFTQWNFDTGRDLNFTFGNFSYHAVDRPWYKLAASLDVNSAKLQFTEPYIYTGSRGNISGVVTALTRLSQTYPFFDDRNILEGVFGLDLSFADIHDTLQNYLQTPNAFIYVTSTEGILVGTSSSDTMVDTEGNLILAKDSKTTSTHITGQYLWRANWTNPGYLKSVQGQMLESGGFSFQVRTMDNAPYFVIVNGAPKSDYTGEIDLVLSDLESALENNVKVVVGISMAVFVVAVAASCALTYYSITVPLSKITIVLRDATNFDFTAYKRLQKQKYNCIRELGTMEHVFYLMIAKFATSIRSQDTLKSASITASAKKAVGSNLEQRGPSRVEVVNSIRK
ncbi:hypothetical protein CcCBS67573_g06221 [Chytriomyces confervae]|uniref:Cache domain-containing protein n=1 Tax=Chytriomyces confervae TaxID=246404 RepID=A0A507F4W2_9FUNG|nr:hypothetical protein CcCBS67573_g06221 [Chytriomyces confervae]